MDSFEYNKVAAAVICALLVHQGGRHAGHFLLDPAPADSQAYAVVVPGAAASGASSVPDAAPSLRDLLASASVDRGRKEARKCRSCHTFAADEGGRSIGPALGDVYERPVGSVPSFRYSKVMSGLGGTWDAEALDRFLESPRRYAKGTSMTFAGLRKPEERAAVIAYLASLKKQQEE